MNAGHQTESIKHHFQQPTATLNVPKLIVAALSMWLLLGGVNVGEQGDISVGHEGQTTSPRVNLAPLSLELPAADPQNINLDEAPPGARGLLRMLVLELLPAKFEQDKQWGKTRERWDGLHVHVDGLKISTKRRWKSVKHGTWKKYQVSPVDPDKHLVLRLGKLREVKPGTVGLDLQLGARLNLLARLQEWNNGVRLLSITTEAVADVELQVDLEVQTALDAAKFPPDVIIRPVANKATVRLGSFRLTRISKVNGPLVHELGDALEGLLRQRLREENKDLAKRINRQISKREDDFRLSLHDFVKHQWLGIQPKESVLQAPSS